MATKIVKNTGKIHESTQIVSNSVSQPNPGLWKYLPYILVYKSNFLDVKMGSKN